MMVVYRLILEALTQALGMDSCLLKVAKLQMGKSLILHPMMTLFSLSLRQVPFLTKVLPEWYLYLRSKESALVK